MAIVHTPTISNETEPMRLPDSLAKRSLRHTTKPHETEPMQLRSSLARELLRLGLAVIGFYWEHRDRPMCDIVGSLQSWKEIAEDPTAAHWVPLYDACAMAEQDAASESKEVRQAVVDARHALMHYLSK